MSTSVTSSPFALSWAKNRNAYKLHCEYLDTAGSKHYVYVNRSASIPAAGNHIVLAIDGVEYVFTIVATSSGNAYEIAGDDELFDKIRGCWYVQRVFSIPSTNNSATRMSMVGKKVGFHTLEIYCTDADGERTGYESTMLTWVLNGGGVDLQNKPNYAIAAELEVIVNNNNQSTTHKVDGLVFQPDENGDVNIPLDILEGYMPQPDIPSTDASRSTWTIVTNLMLKYRLGLGEMWGEDKPLVQNWATLGYCYALCGGIAERYAQLNLPDWQSSETQFSETNNLFRILGEDNNKKVRICRSQAEYLYGMWFDTSVATGTEATVTFAISGGGSSNIVTKTVKNGFVYRIPVGISALGISSSALYYSVSITLGGSTWRRTFIVQPDFYNPTEFLLQSKYGYLRSFVVPRIRREKVEESEELLVDRRRYLDITEDSELYTATTAPMTRDEASRLAQCIGQQFHYVKCGTVWLRVTIEAGSLKVLDEAEDMVSLDFSYRFVENEGESVVKGALTRSTSANLIDFNENLVAFSDRTLPTDNVIL